MAYHFADVSKMVSVGSGAEREIDDIYFTRYACYLTAQNGDARKPAIAFAQNYYDGKPRNLSGTIACRRRLKVSIRPRACFSPSYNKVKSQTKHVWLLTLL